MVCRLGFIRVGKTYLHPLHSAVQPTFSSITNRLRKGSLSRNSWSSPTCGSSRAMLQSVYVDRASSYVGAFRLLGLTVYVWCECS